MWEILKGKTITFENLNETAKKILFKIMPEQTEKCLELKLKMHQIFKVK